MDGIDRVIRNYLIAYGVSPDYKGFQYLLLAIRLGIESPYKLGTIKNLFSEVGQITGVPVSSVAARIRYALVNVDMDEDNESKNKAFIIRAANQIAVGMQGEKNPYAPEYRKKGSLRKRGKKEDRPFSAVRGELNPSLFMDKLEDPVLLLDENLYIRYTNKACLMRLEYSLEDLVGMPFSCVLPEEERQRVGRMLGKSLEEGDFKFTAEHAILTKGGGRALFRITAFTVKAADDEKYTILHMQTAPEPRLESDLLSGVRTLFEMAGGLTNESFYIHDFGGRFVLANQYACDLLGYTRDELLAMSVKDLEQDFDLNAAQAEWAKLRPGTHVTIHGHHRRKDGRMIPVAVSIGCAVLSGEKLYLCLAREMTEVENSEDYYRAIVEITPNPIFIQTDGLFAYVNPAACALLGAGSPEALIRTPVLDRLSPEFRESAVERIQGLNGAFRPETEVAELKFIRLDGETVWAQIIAKPIIYKGRQGSIVYARNTTGRRNAEERLRNSEIKYDTLFYGTNTPIFLLKYPELQIVEVNEAWLRATGFTREEVLGKKPHDLGITRHDESVRRITEELERSGSVRSAELMVYTKAGEELTLLSSVSILRMDNEQYALVSSLDITEHKKDEQKVFEISEKFQKFFDYSAVGMAVIGLDGKLMDVNRKLCETFGCPKEELEGRYINDIAHPDDMQKSERIRHRILSGELPSTFFEKRYVRRNGEDFWSVTTFAVLRDEDGKPMYFIAQIQDVTDYIKTVQALRESEARFRAVLDNSVSVIYRMDIQADRFEYVSPSIETITGYTPQEFLKLSGRELMSYLHPEDRQTMREAVIRLKQTGSAEAVCRIRTKSGEYRLISDHMSLTRDSKGKLLYTNGSIHDITEQQKMRDELRAKDQFFRAVMDSLPVGVAVHTPPNEEFKYMNDNFPRFFRTTRKALQEGSFWEVVFEDPEFQESMRRRVLGDLNSGDPNRRRWDNIPIIRKGSETQYVSAYDATVPGGDELVTIVTDETERVQALRTLENNAARTQALHEFDQEVIRGFEAPEKIGETVLRCVMKLLSPDRAVIGIINVPGGAVTLVKTGKSQTGYRRETVPLKKEELALLGLLRQDTVFGNGEIRDEQLLQWIRRLFRPEGDTYLIKTLYTEARQIGILYTGRTGERDFTAADREAIQVFGIQATLAFEQFMLKRQNERYAAGLEQMVRDRTEQMEEAVKELEAFTYSVSHDLRAPLRTMNGFVRVLQEDYGDRLDDEGKRVCRVIGEGAQNMGRLIDDLLSLSRVGRSSLVYMPVDMGTMVKNLYQQITTEQQRERIDFSVGQLPEAQADPTLIRQVWMNLLENAVKFSSKKPRARIEIAANDAGDEVVYSVTDNGAGFNMNYQDKLFGIFQRLHSLSEFEGTGVGLAIVQRIIRRHGGRVWAQGEENAGAAFYFSLKKEVASDDTGDH